MNTLLKNLQRKTSLFFAIIIFFPFVSNAQLNLSTHNTSLPVEIQSSSLELLRQKQTAHFRKNVVVEQGNLNLFSDELTVYYHPKEKNAQPDSTYTPISKIIALGHVTLKTLQEEATASKATYDVDASLVTLEDNVVLKQGETFVRGNKLTYNLKTGFSILDNNQHQNSPDTHDDHAPQNNDTTDGDGRVRGVFQPK